MLWTILDIADPSYSSQEGCVSRMDIPVAQRLEHQNGVHKVLDLSHSGTKMLPCPNPVV